GTTTIVAPNMSTPTTITIASGDYISISINALVSGNTNPDGGKIEATDSSSTVVEPNNLGLAALGIRVPVSANDANGSILQPLARGPAYTTFAGTLGYNSYAVINQNTSAPGGPEVPEYDTTSPGDVEQHSGSVGANVQIFGGDFEFAQTSGNQIYALQTLSASTATYSNSTEFFRNLIYQAGTPGIVTLSPFVDTTATQYWSVLTPASNNVGGVYQTPTRYGATYFGANDTVGTLPVLVIDVTGLEPHPIVTLG